MLVRTLLVHNLSLFINADIVPNGTRIEILASTLCNIFLVLSVVAVVIKIRIGNRLIFILSTPIHQGGYTRSQLSPKNAAVQ